MTSLFPSQRAAEDFDSVVEGLAPPAVADRYADLFATVETLRTQPEVLPRAEFASDLRSRLMTEAATELVPARARRTPTRAQPHPQAQPPHRHPRCRPGHRRRHRRHGRRRPGLAPGRRALPGQARHRAGQRRGAPERRRQGRRAARPGADPPRRGQGAAGAGLARRRPDRLHARVVPQRRRCRLRQALHRLPGRRRHQRHQHRARLHHRPDGPGGRPVRRVDPGGR